MRLTKKDFQFRPEDIVKLPSTKIADIYNKLRRSEDLEEKSGIDLVLFAKACFDGFYTKEEGLGISAKHTEIFNKEEMCFESEYRDMGATIKFKHYLKDYGITWALTREELENPKRR